MKHWKLCVIAKDVDLWYGIPSSLDKFENRRTGLQESGFWRTLDNAAYLTDKVAT